MGFKSVLQVIGKDVKGVFSWLGSAQGKTVIAAGESVVETIFPQATGLINLANSGLTEIIKVETLAAGAGAQDGSGAQKSAAVVAAMTPEILSYAQKNGLATPTAAQIQLAINSLVGFANAFSVAETAVTK